MSRRNSRTLQLYFIAKISKIQYGFKYAAVNVGSLDFVGYGDSRRKAVKNLKKDLEAHLQCKVILYNITRLN